MIEQIPFFQGLSADDLTKLETISVVKKYKKGEFLFMEGEEPKWLTFLITGSVKLYKTTANGKEIFIHQLAPMNFVAEVVNFENIPYPASAIFTISGEVLKINYEKFEAQFLTKPEICMKFLKSMAQKIRITTNLLHQELILSSEDLFNELKHTKISSILNMTPETFSRILNKFKTNGLVKLDEKNQILEKDVGGLQEIYSY